MQDEQTEQQPDAVVQSAADDASLAAELRAGRLEPVVEPPIAPLEIISLKAIRQQPQQGEMPFAIVQGKALTEIPKDLYIPPEALEVFLEAFEGPLDLLLYLIKRQNLDILEINVAQITEPVSYTHLTLPTICSV